MPTPDETPDDGNEDETSRESNSRDPDQPLGCAEDGCKDRATIELHVPWQANRIVCAGHARVASQREGIVAEPLETDTEDWPDSVKNRNG